MKLLALDIGGTRSRFAHYLYESASTFQIEQLFETTTAQPGVNSFQDLVKVYDTMRPFPFKPVHDYDLVSIAIAGPVNGRRVSPPNISWCIDLDEIDYLPETYILNDFVAQAYALTLSGEIQKLDKIRENTIHTTGTIAVIGAGTGLGHCTMMPVENRQDKYLVLPSEAGQSCFSFTQDEKPVESFMLDKTKQPYATNDLVVSGNGLSLIHEFFTRTRCPANDIFYYAETNRQTLDLFSRFYGRACRNYCLSSYITGSLIISGGIAAKHPELVKSSHFIDEFDNSSSHYSTLKNISIYLNKNENIGLFGACYYALQQHFSN